MNFGVVAGGNLCRSSCCFFCCSTRLIFLQVLSCKQSLNCRCFVYVISTERLGGTIKHKTNFMSTVWVLNGRRHDNTASKRAMVWMGSVQLHAVWGSLLPNWSCGPSQSHLNHLTVVQCPVSVPEQVLLVASLNDFCLLLSSSMVRMTPVNVAHSYDSSYHVKCHTFFCDRKSLVLATSALTEGGTAESC